MTAAADVQFSDRPAQASRPGRGSIRVAHLGACLLVLTFVAYLPVWNNGFVDGDEDIYITNNEQVLSGFTWPGFWWVWDNVQAPYWQPLAWLSLQFDAHFFSTRDPDGRVVPSAVAFHAQNLFWHAASVLALFGLWSRLTGARWKSFFVAALFAIHPMHVESVAWATERKDVLSVFFGILSVWAYVRYTEKRDRRWYLALMAAYLLSFMAKPTLVTLPFVLLLLDYWPLRRWGAAAPVDPASPPPSKRRRFEGAVLEKMPVLLFAVLIAFATLMAAERYGAIVTLGTVSLTSRLANYLIAYGWYVFSTFCPLWLSALYPHPYEHWSPLRALSGGVCLLSITALCFWQARRRPYLVVGWLWFVGTLFPMTGVVQGGPQAWADRFSYWPHIGFFVAVVWGAAELFQRLRLPALVSATVGTAVLAALAVLTWAQVRTWRNTITLWEHAVAVDEDNDWAQERLSMRYRQQGRVEEADYHSNEALRIQRKRLFGK